MFGKNKMMRILVVTEIFYPENSLVNDLVRQWQVDGFQVDILTQHPSYPIGKIFPGYKNEYYSKEQWGNSIIHRFKLVEGYRDSKIKKILNYLTFVRIGTKIISQIGQNYDRVFVFQTGPLTLALPAVAMKKKFGCPLTIWTLDLWPDAVYAYGFPRYFPLTTFLNKIITKVYQNSDHILVSSKKFSSVIQQYVVDKKIIYTPNWIELGENVESILKLENNKFNFTFTGNISMAQNLERVILGWGKARLKNAVLNIVGDGSVLDTLKKLVDSQHISGVFFHGRIPSDQVMDILGQSDMLLLPLIADSGIEKTEPLKLQSYLKAGKPILGVVRGSVREIIQEYELGICADPEDIDDIASKFHLSIDFTERNKGMIMQTSQDLLEKRFNRNIIIKTITDSVLNKG